MATTFSKQFLSGSTSGRGIKIAATGTPGTLIHTAHATDKDEVWLWAQNSDTSDRLLTLEYGGTTSPDDLIQSTIVLKSGLTPILPGMPLSGSVVVRAFAAAANVISVFGYVNRIT
jgi:hypothetical protein